VWRRGSNFNYVVIQALETAPWNLDRGPIKARHLISFIKWALSSISVFKHLPESPTSTIETMSSVNQKITYILFLTILLSSSFTIISPIFKLPSVVSVAAFLAGAFAHPLIVLVIYRTILLRGRAGVDMILGVERHLVLFTAIGMSTVFSSAIREFYLKPLLLRRVFNMRHSQISRSFGPHLLRRTPSRHLRWISGFCDLKNPWRWEEYDGNLWLRPLMGGGSMLYPQQHPHRGYHHLHLHSRYHRLHLHCRCHHQRHQ